MKSYRPFHFTKLMQLLFFFLLPFLPHQFCFSLFWHLFARLISLCKCPTGKTEGRWAMHVHNHFKRHETPSKLPWRLETCMIFIMLSSYTPCLHSQKLFVVFDHPYGLDRQMEAPVPWKLLKPSCLFPFIQHLSEFQCLWGNWQEWHSRSKYCTNEIWFTIILTV